MDEKLLKIFACIFIVLSVLLVSYGVVGGTSYLVLRGTYVTQDEIEGLEYDINDVFNEIYTSYNELENRVKELEERNASYEDELLRQKKEFIESMLFGLGTVKERVRNDNGYHYVIEIGGQIGLFESEDLFSVGEFVLVVEIEEGNSLLVDLD